MTYSAYQGKLISPVATGSVTYSDANFQPKAIIFWSSWETASGDAANTDTMLSFVAGTGATDSAITAVTATNNAATTTWSAVHTDTRTIYSMVEGGGAAVLTANLTAFTSTGFTLNWTATSSGVIIHYLALGGSDITGAKVNRLFAGVATGAQPVTGVGFTPSVVLLLNFVGGLSTNDTAGGLGFGAATSSTSRFVTTLAGTNGVTMATSNKIAHAQDTTKCVLALLPAGTVANSADFVSMDADGFTLNWTTIASGGWIGYLALAGGTYSVGSFTKNANTTDTSVTINAGLSTTPAAYLIASSRATNATVQTDGAVFNLGGTDGTNADSICAETKALVLNTQARRYTDAGAGANHVYHQRALPASVSAAGADEVVFDHSAFTSTGFTLSYGTNATATQYVFPYITFGPNVPAPAVWIPSNPWPQLAPILAQ